MIIYQLKSYSNAQQTQVFSIFQLSVKENQNYFKTIKHYKYYINQNHNIGDVLSLYFWRPSITNNVPISKSFAHDVHALCIPILGIALHDFYISCHGSFSLSYSRCLFIVHAAGWWNTTCWVDGRYGCAAGKGVLSEWDFDISCHNHDTSSSTQFW